MTSVFFAYFLAAVIGWMVSGFVGIPLSLSVLWVLFSPVFVFGLIISRGSGFRSGKASIVVALLLAGLVWIVVVELMSVARFGLTGNWALNLLLPAAIYLYALFFVTYNHKFDALRKVDRVFRYAVVIDLLVTFVEYFGAKFHMYDVSLFTRNPHYTVIYRSFLDVTQVRSPGFFQSGAANGMFLGISALWFIVVQAPVICSFGKAVRKGIAVLCVVALLLTFARRMVIAFVVTLLVWWVAHSFKRKSPAALIFTPLLLVAVGGFAASNPYVFSSYFTDRSLIARFENWGIVTNVLNTNPSGFAIGYGVVQSGISSEMGSLHGIFSSLSIVDNMYLSLLVFGGVPFALLQLGLFGYTLTHGAKLYFCATIDYVQELGVFLVLSTIYFLISGIFGSFWTNLPESVLFWVISMTIVGWIFRHAAHGASLE